MRPLMCALCGQVMSEDNAAEFAVDVPQVPTRIIFRACVDCREKAKTHNLFVCLGCRSVSWFPSGTYLSNGIEYRVKFRCNRCASQDLAAAVT